MSNEDNVARAIRDSFSLAEEMESESSWKSVFTKPHLPIMSAKAAQSYKNVLEAAAIAASPTHASPQPAATATPSTPGKPPLKKGTTAAPAVPSPLAVSPAPGSPILMSPMRSGASALMLAPGAAPALSLVMSPAAKLEAAAALRRATAVSSLSCTSCGSASVVAALGTSGRVLSSGAPDLARRSGGCGLQCVDCSCEEIGNACGGVLFGRRLDLVRTVLVDMSVQARAAEIDKEMAGLDKEVEVLAETTRLKEQLKDLRWKFSDCKRELSETQVRALTTDA